MLYNWQQPDWPEFRYDLQGLEACLIEFAGNAGCVDGLLDGLPETLGSEALLDLMISEALKTSAIEGERLDGESVRSSIRNHLGLNVVPEPVADRMADGAGALMVAVRRSFREPLDEQTLFSWHRMLLENTTPLRVGCWRSGGDPMQVVSGRIDRPTVHFEAPPAVQVPVEMAKFIAWFNQTSPGAGKAIFHPPVRSALAHLYFESIHPFDDGNGRIGRALAEKALSQGLGHPAMLSLSRTIEAKRKQYYETLQSAQRGNEVTPWVRWFVTMVAEAQRDSEAQIRFVATKARFFRKFGEILNERQLKVIQRMFEAGPVGFTGGMNARKYVALTGVSKATATRDLQELAKCGAFVSQGGGRSVRYEIGTV